MKYIIDIPEQIAEASADYMKKVGMAIEPYTEPDRKAIEDAQEEAWGLAKKNALTVPSGGLTINEIKDCYGSDKDFADAVFKDFTYQEAKTKYDDWKAKKESKIEVGDGVYGKINQKNGVVVRIYADDIYSDCVGVMWEDGGLGPFCKIEGLQKTGRHFSQLSDLLKAMKGEK